MTLISEIGVILLTLIEQQNICIPKGRFCSIHEGYMGSFSVLVPNLEINANLSFYNEALNYAATMAYHHKIPYIVDFTQYQ